MRATTKYLGDRRFQTDVGRHVFTTDHNGVGPTPPDFFVASVAACVAIYVANYCAKAGLDATDLTVDLEYAKGDARMSDFAVRVHLPHAVLGARAAAVQRVAERCLVHETIRTFGACPITIEGALPVPA
jgi:putative redox protein